MHNADCLIRDSETESLPLHLGHLISDQETCSIPFQLPAATERYWVGDQSALSQRAIEPSLRNQIPTEQLSFWLRILWLDASILGRLAFLGSNLENAGRRVPADHFDEEGFPRMHYRQVWDCCKLGEECRCLRFLVVWNTPDDSWNIVIFSLLRLAPSEEY